MNNEPITISVKLTDSQASALSQFLSRVIFDDFRRRAMDNDNAYVMQDAAMSIKEALAQAGYEAR
jgi:hypothetical protein